jgi:hypothetical protein
VVNGRWFVLASPSCAHRTLRTHTCRTTTRMRTRTHLHLRTHAHKSTHLHARAHTHTWGAQLCVVAGVGYGELHRYRSTHRRSQELRWQVLHQVCGGPQGGGAAERGLSACPAHQQGPCRQCTPRIAGGQLALGESATPHTRFGLQHLALRTSR